MSFNIVGNNGAKVNVAKIEDLEESLFGIFKGSTKILIIEVDSVGHQIGKAKSTTVVNDFKSFMAAVRKNTKRVVKKDVDVVEQSPNFATGPSSPVSRPTGPATQEVPVEIEHDYASEDTSSITFKQAAVATIGVALLVVGLILLVL